MIQPGDILFYGSSGNLTDMAIAFFTRSPFVHCSVAISPFSQIEALGQGIIQSSIPTPRAIWHLQDNSTDYDTQDLAEAIDWLKSMVGKPYGYSDIATAMRVLTGFYAVQIGHFDCSALCTEFLVKAGGVDLGGLELDPHTVTPAMLASQLKIR